MPTSKDLSGNLSSAMQTPVPSGIAAVSATTRSSFSINSQSVSPKNWVYVGAFAGDLIGFCLLQSNSQSLSPPLASRKTQAHDCYIDPPDPDHRHSTPTH